MFIVFEFRFNNNVSKDDRYRLGAYGKGYCDEGHIRCTRCQVDEGYKNCPHFVLEYAGYEVFSNDLEKFLKMEADDLGYIVTNFL